MKRLTCLRLRIIFSIIATHTVIIALILAALNAVLIRRELDETRGYLRQMAVNGGQRPSRRNYARFLRLLSNVPGGADVLAEDADGIGFPLRLEITGFRNAFAVRLNEQRQIVSTMHDYPLPYTTQEINQIVAKILSEVGTEGLSGGMLWCSAPLPHGETLLCIANVQNELRVSRLLAAYSVVIFVLSLAVAFVFAWVLSGFIVRPVKDAFVKQKRFISDAGHELKTPIAVIGANLDVLLADHGDSKWLRYIKAENERMGQLVQGLLSLARSDSERGRPERTAFDFSLAVENAVLPFESIAFEQGKSLSLAVKPQMTCLGDERQVRQVVMILVDNAIKNSERAAQIRVTACPEGRNNVVRVHNTGQGIQKEDFEKIFERFYRGDESRARATGGYGLGLPIARAIAQAHGGSVSVASKYGEWAEFTFCIPRA